MSSAYMTPRRFELYRRKPPEQHTVGGYANAPDDVQLQGVQFADGTVAIRWLTPLRSTSIWPDFDTFDKVHGHPEYDSELVWLDPPPRPPFSLLDPDTGSGEPASDRGSSAATEGQPIAVPSAKGNDGAVQGNPTHDSVFLDGKPPYW